MRKFLIHFPGSGMFVERQQNQLNNYPRVTLRLRVFAFVLGSSSAHGGLNQKSPLNTRALTIKTFTFTVNLPVPGTESGVHIFFAGYL